MSKTDVQLIGFIDDSASDVISPDGTTLTAGQSGSLVTSAGTWTFAATTNVGGNLILLNGQSAGGGSAVTLEVDNGGNLYADNAQGQWYEWTSSGWNSTSNPNPVSNPNPAVTSPTTTPAFLVVAENALATPIGITAPTDPNGYATVLNDLQSPSALAISNSTGTPVEISDNQFYGLSPTQIVGGSNNQSNNTFLSSEPGLNTQHPWVT